MSDIDEYLRRNVLHCAAIGCEANALAALDRVRRWKRHPLWLTEALHGIAERANRVQDEMAKHRDEVGP